MTQWLKKDVLLFDYDNENTTKFTKVRHTEGVTHYKSLHISLPVVKTNPETKHVNKLWSVVWLRLLSKNSLKSFNRKMKTFIWQIIWI